MSALLTFSLALTMAAGPSLTVRWEKALGPITTLKVLRPAVCPDGTILLGEDTGKLTILSPDGERISEEAAWLDHDTQAISCPAKERFRTFRAGETAEWVAQDGWRSVRKVSSAPSSRTATFAAAADDCDVVISPRGNGASADFLCKHLPPQPLFQAFSTGLRSPDVPMSVNPSLATSLLNGAAAIHPQGRWVAITPLMGGSVFLIDRFSGETRTIAVDRSPSPGAFDAASGVMRPADRVHGGIFLPDGRLAVQTIAKRAGAGYSSRLSLLDLAGATLHSIDLSGREWGLLQSATPDGCLLFTRHTVQQGKVIRVGCMN
jgi:hypothetical protein